LSSETSTTDQKLEQIMDSLRRLENRITILEGKGVTTSAERQKPPSVKEFVISKNPANDTQKTLAVGYYLEKSENNESFNIRDLENGFRAAKEKVPLNLNDKVNGNIRNGHMMAAAERKDGLSAWTLTNTGERFVESGFKAS